MYAHGAVPFVHEAAARYAPGVPLPPPTTNPETVASKSGSRRRTVASWVLIALTTALAVAIAWRGPISQDQEYHGFADGRAGLCVPNAWNVLSNLPFLVVGALGFATLRRASRTRCPSTGPASRDSLRACGPRARWEWAAAIVFCVGVVGTAFGSSLYHWDPRDATLVWDRLPMTLVFSPFLALLLGERLGERVGRAALVPILLLGVGSVVYWAATLDGHRGDDLRPYAFVQGITMITPLVLLVLVPEPRATRWPLALALAAYFLAKQLEGGDAAIYERTGHLVSGHTLKHLAAALAAGYLVRWLGLHFAASPEAPAAAPAPLATASRI